MTTTGKPSRWAHVDGPVSRLLDEIGATDLEYYSARGERVVAEALRAWPLLAAVAHELRAEGVAQRAQRAWRQEAPERETEPTLRVIARTDASDDVEGIEEADVPTSSDEKAKR